MTLLPISFSLYYLLVYFATFSCCRVLKLVFCKIKKNVICISDNIQGITFNLLSSPFYYSCVKLLTNFRTGTTLSFIGIYSRPFSSFSTSRTTCNAVDVRRNATSELALFTFIKLDFTLQNIKHTKCNLATKTLFKSNINNNQKLSKFLDVLSVIISQEQIFFLSKF